MKRCPTVTLSRSSNCMIDYCPDCEVVHLHLGSVSLKLERDSLGALGELVAQAQLSLMRLENDAGTLLAQFYRPSPSAPN